MEFEVNDAKVIATHRVETAPYADGVHEGIVSNFPSLMRQDDLL